MKKILALIAILAIGFGSVNAQDNLRWGVTLGLNSSNFSNDAFSSKVGFHAGAKAEVGLPQIAEGVYLDLGALLSLKGAKANFVSYDIKYNPCYLEIPVHMGYKYAVNENFSVFGNAGPYLAIGLFGKVKTDGIDLSDTSDNVFDEDGGGMKRFDLGIGLKFGVEFCKKYQIAFGYDWGLIDNADHIDNKNRNMMISLSYMF
ncbi:porin family protein [uncultured Bacteroides sp.]|uniref:porin family protein n=1 Tax=uncultured Bacteroides sp. TaxID=162156 RepID=UPI0025EB89F5|nr:porin family protein [uncultured Bacteroides sp.]